MHPYKIIKSLITSRSFLSTKRTYCLLLHNLGKLIFNGLTSRPKNLHQKYLYVNKQINLPCSITARPTSIGFLLFRKKGKNQKKALQPSFYSIYLKCHVIFIFDKAHKKEIKRLKTHESGLCHETLIMQAITHLIT